jgi:protein-histidine N-methyltransferase
MSFAFGFQIDSIPKCDNDVEPQDVTASLPEEALVGRREDEERSDPKAQDAKRRPFAWISHGNLMELWRRRRQRDIYCKTVMERSLPECFCGDDDDDDKPLRTASSQLPGMKQSVPLRHVVLREWDDDDGNNNNRDSNPALRSLSEKASSHDDESEDGHLYGAEGSVLQSGVYEGGGAVWECSMDLVTYLLEEEQQRTVSGEASAPMEDESNCRGRYVLELGCGHALPSCVLLQAALLARPHRNGSVQVDDGLDGPTSARRWMHSTFVMADYNRSVVESITLPNLILNTMDVLANEDGINNAVDEDDTGHEDSITAKAVEAMLSHHIVLGAGDWMDMSEQLLRSSCSDISASSAVKVKHSESCALPQDGYFDMILAAETLYTPQAAAETAQLVMRHLHPHRDSVALVASKRYYFGVGGGVDDFLAAIDASKFYVETAKVVDTGVGNIREILKVTPGISQSFHRG